MRLGDTSKTPRLTWGSERRGGGADRITREALGGSRKNGELDGGECTSAASANPTGRLTRQISPKRSPFERRSRIRVQSTFYFDQGVGNPTTVDSFLRTQAADEPREPLKNRHFHCSWIAS